ncbi:MAG: alpha/beta fold hydrolase [Erysipelotrichaceae bacterium]
MEKILLKELEVEIAYDKIGTGKKSVILLHGWGTDRSLMQPVADKLAKYFTIYNLDWCGFGDSPEPPRAFDTIDYTLVLKQFIKQLAICDPILIAHSFGCRIAMRYASQNSVSKMVLTGAAGLKPKRSLDYYAKVYSYKGLKKIAKLPLFKNIIDPNKWGSTDYKNTSGIMRSTFVKVVNEDVAGLLGSITSEVLLVFGANDEATPLWMGEYLANNLANAGLAIFDNDDHYAYLHQLDRFIKVIKIFLQEEIHEGTV